MTLRAESRGIPYTSNLSVLCISSLPLTCLPSSHVRRFGVCTCLPVSETCVILCKAIIPVSESVVYMHLSFQQNHLITCSCAEPDALTNCQSQTAFPYLTPAVAACRSRLPSKWQHFPSVSFGGHFVGQ